METPRIRGYLHKGIGNEYETFHQFEPTAEFGVTSCITALVDKYDYDLLLAEFNKVIKNYRLCDNCFASTRRQNEESKRVGKDG